MRSFKKHIVIVGSARSGTSWLSETLSQPHRYRMLFEPEQETRTKNGYLLCDKWFHGTVSSKPAKKYLKQVFSNTVDCDWIAQNSNRKWKRHLWPLVPKRFIIKFVRFNLSGLYLREVFNIPVIHIIRNPYDVIRSQLQVQFPWLFDLSHFTAQPDLVAFIKKEFDFNISNYAKLSKTEVLALRWCIENVVPISRFANYLERITVVRYEDLLGDISLLRNICHTFNLEVAPNLDAIYNRPSSKTHPKGALVTNKTMDLSDETIAGINNILDIFKTDLYERRFK
ncbi:sulfotransferase domain-containing protein [Winogradskyella rapida]|uniref:Sulfotransferase domain-containing protein n=1 Tax=Winogradskyella rapida TaxID=549701 RepID=A0ABW3KNP4_9FLAO